MDIKLTFDAFAPLKHKPCIIYCWIGILYMSP